MTPFHFAMQFSQSMMSATISAQKTWAETTLSGFDAITRIHETPEHAAGRASDNAARGTSRSWYRAPAARLSDVSNGYAAMTMAPWQAFMPMANAGGMNPFGLFAPVMSGMMVPFAIPTLFGVAPGGPFQPQNGQTAKTQAHHSEPAVGTSGPASVRSDEAAAQSEAVASITLPDNTTYTITIPMNGPLPFWPWAGGFGAVPYAQAPLTIEAEAETEAPDEDKS